MPDVEISTAAMLSEDESLANDYHTEPDEFYSNTIESLEELEDMDFDTVETMKQKPKVKVEKLCLQRKQAVILTKRPSVTAGVLHELLQIGEKPFGTIKENRLKHYSGRIFDIKRQTGARKRT